MSGDFDKGIEAAAVWRCAGCGVASPNRHRSCECATNVVVRAIEQAWKIDLIDTRIAEVLRSFHRNSCYPEALDGEVEDATKIILAKVRENVAAWMIAHSYPTGHGDTLDDLLNELLGHVRDRKAALRSPASAELPSVEEVAELARVHRTMQAANKKRIRMAIWDDDVKVVGAILSLLQRGSGR